MASVTETRERIVSAALKLFAEKGYDGATTAEIARQAGVAEGTIYRHFADKKELFLACVTPAAEAALQEGLSGVQEATDLRSMVHAMLRARIHLFEENLDAMSLFFTEARYHPELITLFWERVFQPKSDQMLPVLQKLLASGEIRRPPNFTILGMGMNFMIWSFFLFRDQIEAVKKLNPAPISTDDLLDELTEFVLYGIAGQPLGGASQE